MPQVQAKQFPGFGVVYPDGVSGIRVVRTVTQAPKKIVNPDGSIGYETPPPTIHELYGGGFAYADGSPVKIREHLLNLPLTMRERALQWFDGNMGISEKAHDESKPDEKQRPKPVYVLSSDLPKEQDEVTKDLDKQAQVGVDAFAELLKMVKTIEQTVKEQAEQIATLKKKPEVKVDKRRSGNITDEEKAKRSDRMKAMWDKRKGITSGQNTTEASKDVQTV